MAGVRGKGRGAGVWRGRLSGDAMHVRAEEERDHGLCAHRSVGQRRRGEAQPSNETARPPAQLTARGGKDRRRLTLHASGTVDDYRQLHRTAVTGAQREPRGLGRGGDHAWRDIGRALDGAQVDRGVRAARPREVTRLRASHRGETRHCTHERNRRDRPATALSPAPRRPAHKTLHPTPPRWREPSRFAVAAIAMHRPVVDLPTCNVAPSRRRRKGEAQRCDANPRHAAPHRATVTIC